MATQLRVQIREETALEKGVFGEVDTADDVARLELSLLGNDEHHREVHTMTCSVSAKKLRGFRLSCILPKGVMGTSSSGTILVGSKRSKPKRS